ncbi:MAG: hypothetical protein ACSLE1_15855 [Sphingobium sp.]
MTQDDLTFTLPPALIEWRFCPFPSPGEHVVFFNLAPEVYKWAFETYNGHPTSFRIRHDFDVEQKFGSQASLKNPRITFTTVEDAMMFKMRWM